MDHRKLLALVTFVIALSLSGNLHCQEQTENDGYKPELGQKGKDVIWYPTPQELVDVMIDMAKLTPADFLVDLGSGDGRIVIAAAKRGIRAEVLSIIPIWLNYRGKMRPKKVWPIKQILYWLIFMNMIYRKQPRLPCFFYLK